MLVEVINSRTGEVEKAIQVPERSPSEGKDRRTARLYGNYLVVYGNFNNSVIYRVSDGMRMGAFYGSALAGDDKLGLIAANDGGQEIEIYDAATARSLKRVILDHAPLAARFIPEKKVLLVLTANQRVYSIDLPGDIAPSSQQGQ
jgi:hypothetical protein